MRRSGLQEAVARAEAELRSLRQIHEHARHSNKRFRRDSKARLHASHTQLLAVKSILAKSPSILYLCYRCIMHCPAEAAPEERGHVLPADIAARVACPASMASAAAKLAARPRCPLVDRAALLVAEAHVALWLAEVNSKGVAASSMQMSAILRRHWPIDGRSAKTLRFLLRMRHSSVAVRMWSLRFRRRWGISWRRLCTRSEMTPDSIRLRVRFLTKIGTQTESKRGPLIWVPFLVSKMGTV